MYTYMHIEPTKKYTCTCMYVIKSGGLEQARQTVDDCLSPLVLTSTVCAAQAALITPVAWLSCLRVMKIETELLTGV